jgi:hypothetical protein
MKLIKLTLLAFSTLLIAFAVNAQTEKAKGVCYTDELFNEMAAKDPSLLQQRQDLEDYIANFKQTYDPTTIKATVIIPVVVHNVTWTDNNGNVQGYVSKADVEAQLLTMNEDFNRLNSNASQTRAQFLPYAASIDLEFRLAHLDPSGNCTEGIVRKESSTSYNTAVNSAVKSVSYWDSKKYFNIWVIDEIQDNGDGSYVAGFAQFPGSGINNTFGVVCVEQNFGAGSRTMTHEVGHCFNLYHPFQGGCGGSCNSSGDYCCDTPPSSASSFGCPTTINSCSNDASGPSPYSSNELNQIENFMSYNSCQNMFSLDQKTRAMAVLNSTSTSTGLAQLSTPANLAATGTANPYNPAICAPIAKFDYDKEFICEGEAVTFTDDSYNATPTGWNWTFTGGTPATSSLVNPTITYNTAGVYNATHEPSTSAGSATPLTKTNIITVSSLTSQYIGPFLEDFEEITTSFSNDWWVNNDAGQGWTSTTSAAFTGTRSVRIRNHFTGTDGQVDELISPSYDISAAITKTITFKYAFAQKNSGDTDKMLVYYSTNCGDTWTLKLPLTSPTSLPTASNSAAEFVPSAGDWIQKSISLSSIGSATNVRFKFAFTSGGGSNLYLDDINVGGVTVGIDDFSNIASFSVYPNPTSSSAQISFNLTRDVKNLSIKVRNAVGQEVTSVIDGQLFNSGKYTLKIDEQRKLSSGIYFIEFKADDNVKVQKLIVQ